MSLSCDASMCDINTVPFHSYLLVASMVLSQVRFCGPACHKKAWKAWHKPQCQEHQQKQKLKGSSSSSSGSAGASSSQP